MKMAPIDFAVTWSKVKVKQLIYEKILSARSIPLDPFANFSTVDDPRKKMTPIDFEVTW